MHVGIRDFSVTFGSRIVMMLLAVGTQSAIAWSLGAAGRGAYGVCLLLTNVLIIICVFGSEVAAQYFLAAKRMSVSEVVMNTLVFGGLGCGMAIAVGLVGMYAPAAWTPYPPFKWFATFCSKASTSELHLALVLIPATFFSMTFLGLLNSLAEFGWMAVMSVLSALGQLLFILVLVPLLRWGTSGALVAMLLANILTAAAVVVFLRRRYDLGWVRPSRRSLKEMFHYGLRYYVGKVSNQVNFQLGAIILACYANTTQEELGLFTLALVLTRQIMMIPDTLSAVLVPRVAVDKEGRSELVAQSSRVTLVICGVALAGLCLFARPIVRIAFSDEFLGMVPLIWIMSLGVLLRCASKLFVPFLVNTNHPGIASWSVMIGTLVNVVALWLLLPGFGLIGVSWAMTIGYAVGATILAFGFTRISGMPQRETWRFRRTDWAPFAAVWHRIRGPAAAG